MDNFENSSKAGYTPPIKPRLVGDGVPEEPKKAKSGESSDWPTVIIALGLFALVGWFVWVLAR